MKFLECKTKLLAAIFLSFCLGSNVFAEKADTAVVDDVATAEPKKGIFQRSNLLGDPYGFRSNLKKRGVDITAFYVNQAGVNLDGGTSTEVAYSDMFFLGADFDLSKSIFKIKGGSFHVTFTNRNGENLAEEAGLGTNLLVNEVFGQGNITRLNHLFYEQDLFNDAFTLKFGRVNGSFDFFPFSCNFQNLTFCAAIPSYITPNYTPFPGHTWGGIATLRPTKNSYVKVGIFEINPEFDDPDNGLRIESIGDGLGSRTQVEGGYTANFGGLKGTYRAGVFADNVGAANVVTGVEEDSLSGFYFLAEQEVWKGKDGRGITIFASFTQGDEDVAELEQVAEIGAFIKGTFRSRPQDEIGIAVGRIQSNDLLTDLDRANGDPVRESEYPFEVYYAYKATPAITIQPNLQYIANPGGLSENEDAVVLGLKTVFVF